MLGFLTKKQHMEVHDHLTKGLSGCLIAIKALREMNREQANILTAQGKKIQELQKEIAVLTTRISVKGG